MSRGHPAGAFGNGDFPEPVVTNPAGRAFQILSSSPCQLRDVHSLTTKRKGKIPGQASDKILIGIAVWTSKLMIEMGHGQGADGSPLVKGNETAQEGHAVRPARNRDHTRLRCRPSAPHH